VSNSTITASCGYWSMNSSRPSARTVRRGIFSTLHKLSTTLRRGLSRTAVPVALCVSLLALASTTFAQDGNFFPTGNMTTPRVYHTATLLNNGEVLIAGGKSGLCRVYLSSAELYDPATGTFTATGSMTTTRSGHTATLLSNGKVIVAGGQGSSSTVLATAELYDPATGTFTATGSMTTTRDGQTATLLSNGKVLVAGGKDANATFLANAELYDPTTGTFTATGSMTTTRSGHTATLLSNGKVIVAGGQGSSSTVLATAELYDPATGTFTATGSMTTARVADAATLLNNGKVLVTGGEDATPTVLAGAELYDPATGMFTDTASMTTVRENHTATLLSNGQVLVAGGSFFNGSGTHGLFSTELYDPVTGIFTLAGSMNPRFNHTATLLKNNIVLVAGGDSEFFTCFGESANLDAELSSPFVLTPTILSFPNQLLGTPNSQTVTLTNKGSTAVSIASIAISGTNASDFGETDNCVGNLAAGATCSILVSFTPAATGTRTGSLTIANNITLAPLPVSLTGTAVPATRTVGLSSSSLTFSSQTVGSTSAAQGFTIIDSGNVAVTITSLAISGTNGSDFAETDNCNGGLTANAFCTINVTFAPKSIGVRTGVLSVTDDATSPPSPQAVTLTGTGQDFSLVPMSSASTTVSPGQTANFMVTVSPAGGFNQSVTFACSGAPAMSTCAVSPSPIVLNGSTTSMVNVTVATKAASVVVCEPAGSSPSARGGTDPFI
jgi:hypothetical protein